MASGKGSIYGTIAQQFPLHDRPDPPAPPPEPPHSRAPPLRNFYTRPAKKGGYGYLEPGTIGAPFEYMPSPYDREHELEVEAAEKSKKKCVGKAFVGSSHEAPFFQAPLCISSPFTLGAKEHLEQPDKPWRPTSSAQPYLSSFPEYAPPNPQPSRTDMEAAIRDAVAARKAAAADASSGRFRPVGSSCHSYPMTSIIEMNVPKAPSMRVRGMISALRDRATSK
ncbi:hypothetical protein BC828DRAFT_383249 [Blastocladiella britannica]|nr:hypothetical protein BC828DRAFT_383249 [Blastocladiella britannica]